MRLDGYRARQSLVGQRAHCANLYICIHPASTVARIVSEGSGRSRGRGGGAVGAVPPFELKLQDLER